VDEAHDEYLDHVSGAENDRSGVGPDEFSAILKEKRRKLDHIRKGA
jgi:hypothetical protein